jgi:hypothetical protein
MVNPSDLSLHVKSETKGEGDSRREIEHARKSAASNTDKNPLARSAVRTLSLFVAVSTAAAFGTFFYT